MLVDLRAERMAVMGGWKSNTLHIKLLIYTVMEISPILRIIQGKIREF